MVRKIPRANIHLQQHNIKEEEIKWQKINVEYSFCSKVYYFLFKKKMFAPIKKRSIMSILFASNKNIRFLFWPNMSEK